MIWRRLVILDLVLAAVLVAGIVRTRQSWKAFEATHRVENIQPEKEPSRNVPNAILTAAAPTDWTEIPIKNPFSFDRNDVPIVAPKQTAAAEPKPVLFGTMSIGNERIAMLAPASSGNQASRAFKVGESLNNFWQVVEIQDKAVVVSSANGARETLVVNDPVSRVPRTSERTISGNTGPSPIVTAPAAPPTTTSTATSAPTSTPQQPSPGTQQSDEILQTPFGPVRRTRP